MASFIIEDNGFVESKSFLLPFALVRNPKDKLRRNFNF